jgi:uncharacterized protein (TIGR01777 family)
MAGQRPLGAALGREPNMGLHYSSVVDAPPAEVFAWHERPGALARLVPPWQPIKVAQEARSLSDGRAVLLLPGRVRWVAQHSGDDPPHRFVDELVSLPLHWRHTHSFETLEGGGTRVIDDVETPVPGSFLRQTFRYRHHQLAGDLAAHRSAAQRGGPRPAIAVTGSSGLIGSALCAYLSTGGHRVIRLVRRAPHGPFERTWDPERPDPRALEGIDAVVHLAGASIAGRFTDAHKRLVRDSRVGPTSELARVIATMRDGPRILVCASAVGFYGNDRGDELVTEESGRGAGFLAEVVEAWETAARPAVHAGARVVQVRTGIVQSARGASLKLLRPLFSVGLGGPLSPGSQWVSWIGLDDLLDVFGRALADDEVVGPLNAVAPGAVTNADYASTLARVMRRPALVKVPAFGPQMLLGVEGARDLVQASQRVAPARLLAAGHVFRHPSLETCLRHQLGHIDAAPFGEEWQNR